MVSRINARLLHHDKYLCLYESPSAAAKFAPRMRTTATVLLACVFPLGAQPSELSAPITIRGTVVEGGVNSPIANATVILDRPGVTPPEREQTTSAADGSFQFKIQTTGSFTVSASLKGYTGIAGRFGSPSDAQRVVVEPQTKGPLDARLVLARQASITGKIVDFEKSTPLPGMNVALSAISYASGRLLQLRTIVAPTDENGQFEIQPPSTGRFVLSIPDAPSSLF